MKYAVLCLMLITIFLTSAAFASPTTSGLDWAFFKNYMSPAWVWGENGLITIPIADTLGQGHVALSMTGIDAGKLQGEPMAFSTVSLQVGTSTDVELGYTKKFLLYKWLRTDIEGETFHMKVKLLDLSELNAFTPKLSLGTIAFALTNKDNYSTKDMFFNIFAVASQNIAVGRLHLGYEFGMVGQATSTGFFFLGADVPIGPVSIVGEYVGSDVEGKGGVTNAGICYKPFGKTFAISAAAANLGQSSGNRYMLQTSVLF